MIGRMKPEKDDYFSLLEKEAFLFLNAFRIPICIMSFLS